MIIKWTARFWVQSFVGDVSLSPSLPKINLKKKKGFSLSGIYLFLVFIIVASRLEYKLLESRAVCLAHEYIPDPRTVLSTSQMLTNPYWVFWSQKVVSKSHLAVWHWTHQLIFPSLSLSFLSCKVYTVMVIKYLYSECFTNVGCY